MGSQYQISRDCFIDTYKACLFQLTNGENSPLEQEINKGRINYIQKFFFFFEKVTLNLLKKFYKKNE